MATKRYSSRRRTHRRRFRRGRRRGGLWYGLRVATHTDQLRLRVGSAIGRAVIRRWNRRYPHRAAPIVGSWTDPTGTKAKGRIKPSSVKPNSTRPKSMPPHWGTASKPAGPKSTRSSQPNRPSQSNRPSQPNRTTPRPKVSRRPRWAQGRRTRAKQAAVNAGLSPGLVNSWTGPGVSVQPGTLAQHQRRWKWPGTISVTSTSPPGSGGASGPSPAATGQTGHQGFAQPAPAPTPAPPVPAPQASPPAGQPASATTSTAGGNTMSQMNGFEGLGEAPENDAGHCSTMEAFSQWLQGGAEALREHIESLLSEVNMTDKIMGRLHDAADHISEAAEAITDHVADYDSEYGDIRELMANSDGKVPGMDPNNTYWSETR